MISFEIFQFAFMQRALITGTAVAIICSVIGLFLVLRRQSLFGDAMSHVAFGGIALGIFLNLYPIWTAFIVSVLAALGITKLKESTKIPSDSAIAILLSSGLALGVVLISLSQGFSLDLFSFLFGSILLVGFQDEITVLALSIAIISIICLLYKKLMYITFNEEQAKVSGLDVSKLNYLFIILAGITVITSIRLVGVLLISSLLVIPNITAMMFGRGFKKTAIISTIIAVCSVEVGIIFSYIWNIAPGGTIVIVSIIIFLIIMPAKFVFRLLSRKNYTMKDSIRKI
ncbi:MAG TPA: metal ABC transporter permease [Bacillus sp. (in: firmicutes)]|jgi:zinc transport system permease protein|nr:metal ABC transporter permease [Bacillus sp. (in: firmicutes)]